MTRQSTVALLLSTLFASACFACGAPAAEDDMSAEGWLDEESVSQVTQPIWESTCNDYLDDTKSFTFNGSHAAGYGHGSDCNKTFIKQVNNFNKNFLVDVVVWNNALPTTQSACTQAWGAAQLFEWNGTSWTKLTSDSDLNYRKYGTWVPASGIFVAHCRHNIGFPPSLFDQGGTYRIHATMRTARQGSTKPFRYENRYEPF